MGKSIIVLFLSFCQVSNVGSQTATIGPSSNVEVDEHNPVTLSCTYSGSSSSILTVSWLKDGSEIVTLDASDCSVFSGTLDASLYEASCGPFTWKIKDVDVTQDEKAWSCSINTGAAFDSASATLSVQVCPSITGLIANSQVSTTDRSPNTAVVVSCTTQVTGNMTTTCQTAGSWDPQPQLNCDTMDCNPIICWIFVIVIAVGCIIHVSLYFKMQWKFDPLCGSSFLKKLILPDCIISAVGIIWAIVAHLAIEKDCDVGECLVGPLIVSVIESWIPVIVVIIHSQCCVIETCCMCCACCGPWNGNTGGSSCFGGNNSILPICSGPDQGPQPGHGGQGHGGQGHGGQGHGRGHPHGGDNGHPLDQTRQRPVGGDYDHGKQRPLPAAGGDHGLQKSNETAFRPRKLPEIPRGDDKNTRGLSANSDEVVPDQKRLTPLGKETIEQFQESPRKKKKKKKDKGKDVEYDTDF